MEEINPRFTGAIFLSVVVAFALTILPISEKWIVFRPEWLALTFIHWGLVSPTKSSLVFVWFVGLLVDALYGNVMGQHALGFTIVLFLTLRMRSRLLLDSYFQQLFLLFFVLGTYLLINLWILGVTGNTPGGWSYWYTVVSSLLIWPLYHYYMRLYHMQRKPF